MIYIMLVLKAASHWAYFIYYMSRAMHYSVRLECIFICRVNVSLWLHVYETNTDSYVDYDICYNLVHLSDRILYIKYITLVDIIPQTSKLHE